VARTIRFYTDEQMPTVVAAGLRRRGIDVLTVPEAGMCGAADAEQLAFATINARVVVTRDADFLRINAARTEHAGIAFVRPDMTVGDIIRAPTLVFEVLEPEDMVGRVEYL